MDKRTHVRFALSGASDSAPEGVRELSRFAVRRVELFCSRCYEFCAQLCKALRTVILHGRFARLFCWRAVGQKKAAMGGARGGSAMLTSPCSMWAATSARGGAAPWRPRVPLVCPSSVARALRAVRRTLPAVLRPLVGGRLSARGEPRGVHARAWGGRQPCMEGRWARLCVRRAGGRRQAPGLRQPGARSEGPGHRARKVPEKCPSGFFLPALIN